MHIYRSFSYSNDKCVLGFTRERVIKTKRMNERFHRIDIDFNHSVTRPNMPLRLRQASP